MGACSHNQGFSLTQDGISLACNSCGADSHDVERQIALADMLRSLSKEDR